MIGSMVAGMVGHTDSAADYKFLPDQSAAPGVAPQRTSSLKEDIEEAGLIGGLTAGTQYGRWPPSWAAPRWVA